MFQLAKFFLCVGSLACASVASASSVIDLDPGVYQNWLAKSVCVNAAGTVLKADPYPACPSGASLRKIRATDPLPYANIDQIYAQRSDSVPLFRQDGSPLYMHTFDFAPFGEFNLYNGSDGYDVYAEKDGWVSISNTRDGGGYGTTFFGENCNPLDGWRLFPTTGFLQTELNWTQSLIKGIYWEKSRQSFPGTCAPNELASVNTSYQKVSSFAFGSLNYAQAKKMDAVVVNHGYPDNIERFYFTREYGLTRWEAWSVTVPNAMITTCNGDAIKTFDGPPGTLPASKVYYRVDCRDWSNTQILSEPSQLAWPVVNANLLNYAHFNGGFSDQNTVQGMWHRFYPANGPVINWSALVSETGGDNKLGNTILPGTAYLAFNCGASVCPQAGTQAIYQDMPITSFCSGCTYLYGVNARRTSGIEPGGLSIALQVVNNGAVVWQDVGYAVLASKNGDPAFDYGDSVVLNAAFLKRVVTLPSLAGLSPNAYVRFLILPNASNTFNVVDAFVNPFPSMIGTLAAP